MRELGNFKNSILIGYVLICCIETRKFQARLDLTRSLVAIAVPRFQCKETLVG